METIRIACGPWQGEIAPALGGNLIRLDWQKTHILRPLERKEQMKEDPFTIGSPLLLPANRTRSGHFSFCGRDYQLVLNEPQRNSHLHGLLHRGVFTVEQAGAAEATLSLENRGEFYPFPFRLTVRYCLELKQALAQYCIRNIGKGPMIFTFGLHTTFAEPASFQVALVSAQERDENCLPTGRIVGLNRVEQDCVTGMNPHGKVLSGCYLSGGNVAQVGDFRYRVSENFTHWVLYNGGGHSGFLCVEPQCGGVDGLNLGDCPVLEPGEEMVFSTSISHG